MATHGMTHTVRALLEVLADLDFPISEPVKIERTYAGYWQRSEGAWSWLLLSDRQILVGSQWAAGECIKAHREGRTRLYFPDNGSPEITVSNVPFPDHVRLKPPGG